MLGREMKPVSRISSVAHDLRRHHRIIGTSTGTAVGFIQQNAQLGLPLQLSQFEAALAEEQGWIYVAADEEASSGTNAAPGVGEHQAASADVITEECTSRGTHHTAHDSCGEGSQGSASDEEYHQPDWLAAIRSGLPFELAAGVSDDAAGPSVIRAPFIVHSASDDADHCLRELRRHLVFRDLHGRGFCVTGGHKFGGDFLAYEGDPCLFHGRYSVRVLHDARAHCKPLAAAANRGAHGAKKRYLLASVHPDALAAAAAGDVAAATAVPVEYRAVVQVLGGGASGDVASEPFDVMQWSADDNLSKLCQNPVELPLWALDDSQ